MSALGESTGKKLRRYLIAVWLVAAVFVLTMFATRYVQMDVSLVYLAAVMFSTWRGGLGAGLLATALSAIVGAFFFLPPAYSFKVDGEDVLELGVPSSLTLSRTTPQRQKTNHSCHRISV